MSWERFQTFFIKMFYQCQKEEEREKRHFCKRSKEKKDILEEQSLASVLSSSCTTTSSHGQYGLSSETLAADLNGQCLPLSPSPGKSMTRKVWVCIRRSLSSSLRQLPRTLAWSGNKHSSRCYSAQIRCLHLFKASEINLGRFIVGTRAGPLYQ